MSCTKLLESCTVSDLAQLSAHPQLITCHPDDSVQQILTILSNHRITSVPVFDPNLQKIIGNISIMDVLNYFLVNQILEREESEHKRRRLNVVAKDLIEASFEPFHPIAMNQNLVSLIKNYFALGIHRVPVQDEGHHIIGFVSQSDLISFLAQNLPNLGSMPSKTVEDCNLSEGPVTLIPDCMGLRESWGLLYGSGIMGAPVVDKEGKIVGSFSASDFKTLNARSLPWSISIKEFLQVQKTGPLICCRKEETLGEVITKLREAKVHRLFVVDEEMRPRNVVTLTSLIKILQSQSECFV